MKHIRTTLLILAGLVGIAVIISLLRSDPEAGDADAIVSPAPITQSDSLSGAETRRDPIPTRRWLTSAMSSTATREHGSVPSAETLADPDEARRWARENLEDARAWLISAEPGSGRDTIAEMVCAKVAESNPAEAVELCEQYAGSCSNLLENLVQQWSEHDENSARTYALSKPAGNERDRLLSRVAFVQSRSDPRSAAKLVVEEMSPGNLQDEAALSVLQQWKSQDPTGAVAWAKLFGNDLRERAINEATLLQSQ